MYENILFEFATANAYSLVVFTILCLILDWLRTILFKDVK